MENGKADSVQRQTGIFSGVYRRWASLAFFSAVLLTGCDGSSNGYTTAVDLTPLPNTQWALQSASNRSLTNYFRAALGASSQTYMSSPWATDAALTSAATPAASVSVSSNGALFSGTTLQEAGVDEADWIKSDGSQVFSLDPSDSSNTVRGVLRRQKLDTAAAALTPMDSLKLVFSADVQGAGLYLDEERKQVAVIADGRMSTGVFDAWFAPQMWRQGVTEVVLVDTANASKMQTRRTLRMTAQLIGSRRLGSTLYLVLRSYPQVAGLDPTWPADKVAANQALLDSLQASQLLPTLSVDGGTAQPLVSADSCFTQGNNAVKSADIITIVGIDLAATGHQHAARCFTGGTEAFYMSDQSLYLATTRSAYSYSGAVPVYEGQSSTDIHKFALNGLAISYRGSGNVTGHLGFDQNRKSFRMGEHQGTLRVITQTAPTWGGWLALPMNVASALTSSTMKAAPEESPGHLSVLQESEGELKVIAELPNAKRPQALGKLGEQLYASRFVGSRGYLVTYRLTDPLYVLDLSDPADPKVAGELQVSGYSDYLFPLTDTLLLGVGKDAISDGSSGDGRFAWYQGIKLSLIDVSNPAQPREAARSIIGRRGTDATVLHDHHGIALHTVGNTVRVGLPVSLHETAPATGGSAASDYFQFTRSELQKFDINLSTLSLGAKNPLPSQVQEERDIRFDRSLLWNNQLHYYQNGIWQSAPW